MRARVGGVVLAVTGMAVAACGPAAGGAVVPAPGGALAPPWTSCTAEAPQRFEPGGDPSEAPLARLAADFVPAAAVVCAQETRKRPDGAQELVATEKRADNVAALVTAVRLPDAPKTDGACTLDMEIPPWVALLDARGGWVRPALPVDGCGKVRPEVRQALAGLTLTPVATRVIRELESAAAAAAKCSQISTDMVGITADPRISRPVVGPVQVPWRAASQLRVCGYHVPPTEPRGGKRAGNFAYGRLVPSAVVASVDKALRSAGPARACAKVASQFAILRAADGKSGEIHVELDGCHRILSTARTGRSVLSQGSPALTAPLVL